MNDSEEEEEKCVICGREFDPSMRVRVMSSNSDYLVDSTQVCGFDCAFRLQKKQREQNAKK